MSIKLYGLKNCSTCKKAIKWLTEHNIEHEFYDVRESPVAEKTLLDWADRLGWKKLINRSSTTWRSLDDTQKYAESSEDLLALVQNHPTLIKRPILDTGNDLQAGFKAEAYESALGGKI